jgi:signal transduction histidine kinase/CheY-like chemotaxis protein
MSARLGPLLKILLPVFAVFSLAFLLLLSYASKISLKNAEDRAVANATRTVNEFKTLRSYYTDQVVRKVRQHSKLAVSFDHRDHEETIPMPATMIHDLSEIISNDAGGVKLKLYSAFPFPARSGRVLDSFAKEAVRRLNLEPERPYVKSEMEPGAERVRVGIADKMTVQACVDCHNSHPLSPKRDWRLGDVRGVLEVDMPLHEDLARSRSATLAIGGMAFAALLLASLALSWLIDSKILRTFRADASDIEKAAESSAVPASTQARSQLKVSLRYISLADLCFALFLYADYLSSGELKSGFGALYCGIFGLVLIWAHHQLSIGDSEGPLLAIFWWIQGSTLIAAIPPVSYVTLGLLPVLGLLMVLPLLRSRNPRRYLLYSWLATAISFGLSFVLTSAPVNSAGYYIDTLSVLVASGLTLLLVWQQKLTLQAVFNESQEMENKFRQSQKIEVVGRLAGGIAHDFNNLLTVIKAHSDMLLRGAAPDSEARSSLEDIAKAVRRASSLTRQLLAFSRRQVLVPQVIELNSILSNIGGMLRPLIGETITLKIVLSAEAGRVKADPHQIEQVLVNLAVNARDAMPQGGTLTFETLNTVFSGKEARDLAGLEPGPYVVIAASDTGVGIDRSQLEKIFEPYFTTKAAGHGTGLGLSTVKGIVEQSGGQIRVYSETGKGSVFKVFLPRVDEPLAAAAKAPAPPAAKGRGKVLLVEDDALLLKATTAILTGGGYEVITAANGQEALERCQGMERCPDLLVTDVIMPEMSGIQLTRALRTRWPELKVLLVSGYTENAVMENGHLEAGTEFLAKPFGDLDLLAKLRELLG